MSRSWPHVRRGAARGRVASRSAFSLAEAVISIGILSVAGGTIMFGLTTAVDTVQSAVEKAVAHNIAKQVVDEVMGQRYHAPGGNPYQTTLTANNWELNGQGRERFDDTDDYEGFSAKPVEDVWGFELGKGDDVGGLRHPNFRLPGEFFSNWGQSIEVYYVDESDHSIRLTGNNTSGFRAVEVRIYHDGDDGLQRELARVRRVYAYIPPPPS